REARQLISGGGILVNDVKIADPNEQIDFAEGSVIVKKGKKVIHKVVKA
ncbi:MAG: tyrosine--tRNA ligase, partial [Ruminiclostridium sp.]|nr:tyrosine--tRNA ligase [Ruminiclostridium sp.]